MDAVASDEDEEGDEDADEERWWCFKSAKEIRALMKWLGDTAVAKDHALVVASARSSSTTSGLSQLQPGPGGRSILPAPAPLDTAASNSKSKVPTPNANRIRPLLTGLKNFADFLDSRFGKDDD